MTHLPPDTTASQSGPLFGSLTERVIGPHINAPEINATEIKEALITLISDRTGLEIKPQDREPLYQQLETRVRTFSPPFLTAYYQHLSQASLENQPEWSYISQLLTNGESFFFRDRGQFLTLRQHILPDVINRRAATKQLRICSAGCATGEEAYSLVVLIHELLAQLGHSVDQWTIQVYGLDINPTAIACAQAGVYRDWSLRGVDPQQRQAYFHQVGDLFHLAPKFKSHVTFYPFNLVGDPFVQKAEDIFSGVPIHDPLDELDLIVCRNVFIYFSAAAIATVIRKFYQALSPLGYLLTGHAELHGQDLGRLQVITLPESLVFQRPATDLPTPQQALSQQTGEAPLSKNGSRSHSAPGSHSKNYPENQPALSQPNTEIKNTEITGTALHKKAETLLKNKALRPALYHAEKALEQQPNNPTTLSLIAQIHFQLNQAQQAIHYCQAAIKADGCFLAPHYLLANIFTGQGELTAAKRILKKIIYLEPNAVIAYLELSQIYRQEGNLQKSNLMRRAAFDIFRQHLPQPSS